MKNLIKTIICFCFFMIVMSISAQEKNGDAMYREGEKYQEAGDFDNAIRCFKLAAEQGYADATSCLGDIYKNEKEDYVQALIWYNKWVSFLNELIDKNVKEEIEDDGLSICLGDVYYKMGKIFENGGHGVERNLAKAVSVYEKSAEMGFPAAWEIYNIAESYWHGNEGIEKDEEQALILYKKAYNYGEKDAAMALGFFYLEGIGGEKDEKMGFKYLKEYTDNGEDANYMRDALRILGMCYADGIGTEKDMEKAFYYTTKAAEKEDPIAQRNLYGFYRESAKDDKKAFYWISKAADNGLIDAQQDLGWCYEKGIGTEVDNDMAVKWYQSAADKGDANALNNLAMMYYHGKGVPQDYNKAFTLEQKSAEAGNDVAQYNLAYMYENGHGVELDFKKAFFWYKKAAEQDHADACWKVCCMYYEGKGVKKDTTEWFNWRKKAIQLGHPAALAEEKMFENARARQNVGH